MIMICGIKSTKKDKMLYMPLKSTANKMKFSCEYRVDMALNHTTEIKPILQRDLHPQYFYLPYCLSGVECFSDFEDIIYDHLMKLSHRNIESWIQSH